MEKEILIPMIVILGVFTFGIAIYIYYRTRQKPIAVLQEIVVAEDSKKIKKDDENSIDNSTNISYDSTIPVGDVDVVEENLDRIVRVGNLRMTERDRLRLKDAAEKRGVNIDNLQQAYNNMMDNQIAASDRFIAGLERLEQGCDRIIEAGNNRIEAGNRFIAHCDNMTKNCDTSIVFGTLALVMSAVSIDDETIQNNLNN